MEEQDIGEKRFIGVACSADNILASDGMVLDYYKPCFRLLVAQVKLGSWREGWNWVKSVADDMGWWTVLCGMDFWIQGVPIIRVTITVNMVMWVLMWLVLRR